MLGNKGHNIHHNSLGIRRDGIRGRGDHSGCCDSGDYSIVRPQLRLQLQVRPLELPKPSPEIVKTEE